MLVEGAEKFIRVFLRWHAPMYYCARMSMIFSSPGTNVLGDVLSYPRRRRCRRCRRCRRRRRRQFQAKVFVY